MIWFQLKLVTKMCVTPHFKSPLGLYFLSSPSLTHTHTLRNWLYSGPICVLSELPGLVSTNLFSMFAAGEKSHRCLSAAFISPHISSEDTNRKKKKLQGICLKWLVSSKSHSACVDFHFLCEEIYYTLFAVVYSQLLSQLCFVYLKDSQAFCGSPQDS